MTDQTNQQVDTSQHQEEYQLQQNDALDIALLANVVGKELTQVDKFAVSGLQKATRIDQQKIFDRPPTSAAQAPKPTGLPPELQQVQSSEPPEPPPVVPKTPAPKPVPQVAQTDERVFNYLKTIEQRLEKMESLYNSILETIQNNTEQITVTLTKNDKN